MIQLLTLSWILPVVVLVQGGLVNISQPCCSSFPSLIGQIGLYSYQPLEGELMLASPLLACTPLIPSNNFLSKIVLVQRGNCSFLLKAINAQKAGALAVLIFNDKHEDKLVLMKGDYVAKLPVFFMYKRDGDTLLSLPNATLSSSVRVILHTDNSDVNAYFGTIATVDFFLVNFGIGCAVLLSVSLVYALVYMMCWRRRRMQGRRLVRRIKYRVSQQQPVAPSSSPPAPLVDVELLLNETTTEEEVLEQRPQEPFAIVVVPNMPPRSASSSPHKKCCCWPRSSSSSSFPPATPRVTDLFDSGGTCSICLEDFVELQNVFVLPCGHLFHELCVNEWLKGHGNCPNCKTELVEDPNRKSKWEFLWRLTPNFMIPLFFALMVLGVMISFFVSAGV